MKNKKKFPLIIIIVILLVVSISLIVLIKQLKITDKFVAKKDELSDRNIPSYTDSCEVHPNRPVLNGDMIPVVYDEEQESWVKQDLDKSYDYCSQVWANAVTVIADQREAMKAKKVGEEIPMKYINTMWVWIPRYSYTIKSEDNGLNYLGKASFGNENPTRELPGEIDVKFIKDETEEGTATYIGENPSGWRTNDAFNFGGEKTSGFWVGKFRISGELQEPCKDENCQIEDIVMKPDEYPFFDKMSSYFYMIRSMQANKTNPYGLDSTKGDSHMIKNDEWGAVAYLSQSRCGKYGNSNYTGKNKEVKQIYKNTIWSMSSSIDEETSVLQTEYAYNDMTNLGIDDDGNKIGLAGPGESTTGTIYGVYDMTDAYENVMGVLVNSETDTIPMVGIIGYNDRIFNSGFNGKLANGEDYKDGVALPDSKYYNVYKVQNNSFNPETDCNKTVCLGHALSEVFGFSKDDGNEFTGWYDDYFVPINNVYPWLERGGNGGIFSAVRYSYYSSIVSHPVLISK